MENLALLSASLYDAWHFIDKTHQLITIYFSNSSNNLFAML